MSWIERAPEFSLLGVEVDHERSNSHIITQEEERSSNGSGEEKTIATNKGRGYVGLKIGTRAALAVVGKKEGPRESDASFPEDSLHDAQTRVYIYRPEFH
jgi:hypothetical protein